MKKINSLFTTLLLTASLFFTQQSNPQAPQKMSYQSVIRNSSNVLLTNTVVGIKISVLQGSASGTAVYVETQTATTNGNGLVSLQIGNGTADLTSITIPDSVTSIGNDAFTTGTFAGINWANGPYFIKTETDPAGGANYTITGTQELLSVPYALYAKTAENGITTAQADAITAQANAITAMQGQITALQAQVATLLLPDITIGTQVWTTTNLDVATYSDGTVIPQVTDPTAWANLTTGAWCYYNNDSATGTTYGKLYNWYAVAGIHDTDLNTPNKKLAPTGYHIPSDAEWTTLTTYLGGETVAGGKMKATGTSLWYTPNGQATNSSGFTGLPGGYRYYIGAFNGFGSSGYWWSSSEDDAPNAWYRNLNSSNGNANSYNDYKTNGFSVRCLRD